MPLTEQEKLARTKRIILWLKVLGAVLVVIILLSAIRGCQNARKQVAVADAIKEDIARLKRDSIEADKQLDRLKKDSAGLHELVTINERNQELLEQELFDKEQKNLQLARRIQYLINNDPDTIEIIDKCEELAEAYVNEYNVSQRLKATNDSLIDALKKQSNKTTEIAAHWKGRYDSAMAVINRVEVALPAIKQRGKVSLDITALAGSPLIGAGGGLTYTTKGGKSYSLNGLLTTQGTLIMGKVGLPLSFRKKP